MCLTSICSDPVSVRPPPKKNKPNQNQGNMYIGVGTGGSQTLTNPLQRPSFTELGVMSGHPFEDFLSLWSYCQGVSVISRLC